MKWKVLSLKSKFLIKSISFAIMLSVIFSCSAYATESTSSVLGTARFCYLQNYDASGLIAPSTISENSIVTPNDRGFVNSNLWRFEYIYGSDNYYAIRYTGADNYEYYLKYTPNDAVNSITIAESDIYSLTDDLIWKIDCIGSGLFFDNCTISSKVDENKYLVINNGQVSVENGPGFGRFSATRYWLLHDKDRPVTRLKNTYSGSSGRSDLKPIALASTYHKTETYGKQRYFGQYVNSGTTPYTLQSCRAIGASSIKEYDGFNEKGLAEIISESSLCVISTHGNSNGLTCQNYYSNYEGYIDTDFLEEEIPNSYFIGTKCVLLSACASASGTPNGSFADVLYEKGVQSVVAFTEDIPYETMLNGKINPDLADQKFIKFFLNSLANGDNINDAKDEAVKNVKVVYPEFNSCVIIGNKNLTF